jgi:DnaK suppressor protein
MNSHPNALPMSELSTHERLRGMRVELMARHQRLHKHYDSEPRSADSSERAVESENDEVVESLDRATALELVKIEKAIARLIAGNYGICSDCGAMTEPARLHALPQANECISCAGLR